MSRTKRQGFFEGLRAGIHEGTRDARTDGKPLPAERWQRLPPRDPPVKGMFLLVILLSVIFLAAVYALIRTF